MALSLDRSLDTIYAANSRLRKLLEEQDGYHWKDKLPEHPERDSITQALSQRSFTDTANTSPAASTSPTANTSDTSDSTSTTHPREGVDGVTLPPSSTGPAPPPAITTSTASTAADLSTNVSPL